MKCLFPPNNWLLLEQCWIWGIPKIGVWVVNYSGGLAGRDDKASVLVFVFY